MRSALGLLLVLVISLLAGCFSSPSDNGSPDEEDPQLPGPEPFEARTLYLSDDEGLVDDAPEEPGSVPAGDFILKWATNDGTYPTFNQSFDPNQGFDWISPDNATVTLYITTDLPVLPAEGALPDVAVWLGSGHHAALVGSTVLDAPLMPDEVVEVTFDLPGPASQPPILTLDGVALIASVTMTQHDAHNVRILTGGEHASQVTFETRPVHPDDVDGTEEFEVENDTISGEVPFFERVVGPAPEDDVNFVEHGFEIADDALAFLAFVYASGGGHTVDMDMQLLDEDGETVTWGVTPYAVEILWLIGDNLEPYRGETLTLRIANHMGAQMEYEGEIQSG